MRSRVSDFLRRPLSSSELQETLDRTLNRVQRGSARMGKVLSFVSNKGGAGKSTISVNTAVALAMRHPGEVLLVDTSLQLGVAAMMLDVAPRTTIVDAIRETGASCAHTAVIFYYDIYPETVTRLGDHGVALHYLCTWWDVLAEARARGDFDAETLDSVDSYLRAPKDWTPPAA